ncbi:MAG: DapH/DapD/GlmU-related protein [Planctomycetota bacterium]|nr:DapH/DapD/GlmU-related protein [Planctomycetota bacterium]
MSLLRSLFVRAMHRAGKEPSGASLLTDRDMARVLWRGLTYRLRGLYHQPWLGACRGALFVGPGTSLHHSGHLYLGRQVKIEDGAEIHALSSDGVHLGDGVTIGRMASVRPSGYYGTDLGHGLRVGAGSAVGAFSWIGASGPVVIGEQVLMGPRVVILPENHIFEDVNRPIQEQGVERLGVTIEDDCWIGADAKILAGVWIGKGSIVAAGAVVTRDVPAGHIVGGVPARILRDRGRGVSGQEAAA